MVFGNFHWHNETVVSLPVAESIVETSSSVEGTGIAAVDLSLIQCREGWMRIRWPENLR